jgi:hypothetical protein
MLITIYDENGNPYKVNQSQMVEMLGSGEYKAEKPEKGTTPKKKSYNYQKKEETGTE